MSLIDELQEARKEIKTDSYPVTVRELISLYKEGELDIHPEFQRFMRWSDEQKTKLIESLLLGIPIPSIFLYQRTDGVLDVVDGLQRISTILQFVGELKDENGAAVEPLRLGEAQYLPSLLGKYWVSSAGSAAEEFSDELKRYFRQEKIDLKILLRESDDQAKFELFQRINTGGTPLSDQEVRNCILIMLNRDSYFWLEGLAGDENFKGACPIPERLELERYEVELALRFVLLFDLPVDEVVGIPDLGKFLTEKMSAILGSSEFDGAVPADVFHRTFARLYEVLGDNALRKFDTGRDRFMGPFLISAFELVALGVAWNIDFVERQSDAWLEEKVRRAWNLDNLNEIYGRAISSRRRLPRLLEAGREHFSTV